MHLKEGLSEEAEEQDAALQIFYFSPTGGADSGGISGEVLRWFEIALRSKTDGIILFKTAGLDVERLMEAAESAQIPFVPLAMDVSQEWINIGVTGDSASQGREASALALGMLGAAARIGIILSSDTSWAMLSMRNHSIEENRRNSQKQTRSRNCRCRARRREHSRRRRCLRAHVS